MLARLKFGQKIALMPAVTGVGVIAVLITVVVFGGRTSEQLRLIEEGYYPSSQMSGYLKVGAQNRCKLLHRRRSSRTQRRRALRRFA